MEICKATGATISTVATLSMKAEIIPENNARAIIAHFTFGVFSIRMSANLEGILASIKRDTTPMVPAIIKITFQSMAANTSILGKIPANPSTTKITADPSAI